VVVIDSRRVICECVRLEVRTELRPIGISACFLLLRILISTPNQFEWEFGQDRDEINLLKFRSDEGRQLSYVIK
jgi:hypothetical protein